MTALADNAKEAAEESRVLFRAGHYGGACSRAYFAMFNMARALLLEKGYRPEEAKTHKSVLRLFSMAFVKPGLFEAQNGRALREAYDARQEADYEGGISERDAATILASMEHFLKIADVALGDLNNSQEKS